MGKTELHNHSVPDTVLSVAYILSYILIDV